MGKRTRFKTYGWMAARNERLTMEEFFMLLFVPFLGIVWSYLFVKACFIKGGKNG